MYPWIWHAVNASPGGPASGGPADPEEVEQPATTRRKRAADAVASK
jgi:hypothetical protein